MIPDHPDIRMIERTGFAYRPAAPHCPVCGKETDTFYRNAHGEIVGCEECLCAIDAWDYEEDY